MGADMLASSLTEKDYKGFWNIIQHSSNDNATCHATTICGCSGSANIAGMWKDHFEGIYKAQDQFLSSLSTATDDNQNFTITIEDISEALQRQNKRRLLVLMVFIWNLT